MLYLTSHIAHIQLTSKFHYRTTIQFSIDDRKDLAWYSYTEDETEFRDQMMEDLMNSTKTKYFVIGQPTKSTPFPPNHNRRVYEFVNPGSTARARGRKKGEGNKFIYRIGILLSNGYEPLNCEFEMTDKGRVAHNVSIRETGVVSLTKVERYSAAKITSHLRYLDSTSLTPVLP